MPTISRRPFVARVHEMARPRRLATIRAPWRSAFGRTHYCHFPNTDGLAACPRRSDLRTTTTLIVDLITSGRVMRDRFTRSSDRPIDAPARPMGYMHHWPWPAAAPLSWIAPSAHRSTTCRMLRAPGERRFCLAGVEGRVCSRDCAIARWTLLDGLKLLGANRLGPFGSNCVHSHRLRGPWFIRTAGRGDAF